jgi:hypothetical protein
MPRPHFTLRVLLVAMLVVAAFFAGGVATKERNGVATLETLERWSSLASASNATMPQKTLP